MEYAIILRHLLNGANVSTDTRLIEKGDIFFALKGENFNGNKFAATALEKGAELVIIDEPIITLPDEKTVLVPDVLTALQEISNLYRKIFKFPVIGITGSNGKTTTKELFANVLSKKYKTKATKGNLNNHIGVPLTILNTPLNTEMLIVEMGANHIGEINQLCKIAEPTHGIITNVGKAHLEGFGSFEGVKQGKGELYKFLSEKKGTIFINSMNNQLIKMLGNSNADIISYGENIDDFTTGSLKATDPFVRVEIFDKSCMVEGNANKIINSKLVGSYNFENILAAANIGMFFGVEFEDIKQAIENYLPSNNRSQLQETDKNKIIIDCYNANPTSMKNAIDNLSKMQGSNKLAVLGDMLELGSETESEHQKIIELLREHGLEAYLVGEEFFKIKTEFRSFKNVEELIESINTESLENRTILLKGSRGIRLEKVIEYL